MLVLPNLWKAIDQMEFSFGFLILGSNEFADPQACIRMFIEVLLHFCLYIFPELWLKSPLQKLVKIHGAVNFSSNALIEKVINLFKAFVFWTK